MEIKINAIEVAAELAHIRTLYESGDICNSEDDMYNDCNAGITEYTDEIQDRFNEWYDFYLTQIEKYGEKIFTGR
jgi:hypothetical protein